MAFQQALSGLNTAGKAIDVTSHNIANSSTVGYKASVAHFSDVYARSLNGSGANQVGIGVNLSGIAQQFTQGNITTTNNPLDISINGNGFFQIQLPDGTTAYTRNGSFKLDGTGTVVTADGYPLIPQMVIPADATKVSIATDGTVSVLQPGQTALQQIGQIETATFVNPAGLHALGDNNYINTTASGDPITGVPGLEGRGGIRQGFVEMSNVQLVEEMTDLIVGQRAYEANSKAILTSDEMLSIVNALKK